MIDGVKLCWTIEVHPDGTEVHETSATNVVQPLSIIQDRLLRGDLWAWCRVVVRCWPVGYPEVCGVDHLPCASYKSEEDFATKSPFYIEMRMNALRDLDAKLIGLKGLELDLPKFVPYVGQAVYLSALPHDERYKLTIIDPSKLTDQPPEGHVMVQGVREYFPSALFSVPLSELRHTFP